LHQFAKLDVISLLRKFLLGKLFRIINPTFNEKEVFAVLVAVLNSVGKVVMECVIETKAGVILQFLNGLSGELQVTFEEGTAAAWLYNLLKPHVTRLVVCNPRRNALLKVDNKSDRIDRRLPELLRGKQLYPGWSIVRVATLLVTHPRWEPICGKAARTVLCGGR
jgi:hypothetical protein